MSAGIKYDKKPIEGTMPEMLRYETVHRLSGGFNLDTSNLSGVKQIPPATPLVIDFKKRVAKAVINVKVYEALASGGTSLKVKKGSLAYVGMILGNGTKGATVKSIDKTNDDYDVLTLDGTPELTAAKNKVLFEASAAGGTTQKATATFLNYAWTKVEEGATVTAIGRAYEIKESKLIAPISEKDKTSLGDRFMFIDDED